MYVQYLVHNSVSLPYSLSQEHIVSGWAYEPLRPGLCDMAGRVSEEADHTTAHCQPW